MPLSRNHAVEKNEISHGGASFAAESRQSTASATMGAPAALVVRAAAGEGDVSHAVAVAGPCQAAWATTGIQTSVDRPRSAWRVERRSRPASSSTPGARSISRHFLLR